MTLEPLNLVNLHKTKFSIDAVTSKEGDAEIGYGFRVLLEIDVTGMRRWIQLRSWLWNPLCW